MTKLEEQMGAKQNMILNEEQKGQFRNLEVWKMIKSTVLKEQEYSIIWRNNIRQ